MVPFELLQLVGFFLDYLRVEYLWHAPIMPLTNRNGITWSPPVYRPHGHLSRARRLFPRRAHISEPRKAQAQLPRTPSLRSSVCPMTLVRRSLSGAIIRVLAVSYVCQAMNL